ncbi:MAG: single-stranded DNA-binding protein [Rhodospirillales bacterium]|nr:single-stranded DNA-binding protein [Acetobacter sp.]
MAKGVNKVLLLGNVGKDPEIRASQGGMTIASFTLATADRQKDQSGQWADKTEWHNLVAFGRTAEIVRDYVKKGTQLFVEGKIQTRDWVDKESGQKKYRTEILVNDMSLLGGRNGAEGGGNYERQGSYAGAASSQSGNYSSGNSYAGSRTNNNSGGYSQPMNDYADQGITDEDIPF